MSHPPGGLARDRVALVHDFFVTIGGADLVAIELARILPSAPVYTTFFDDANFGPLLDRSRVRTWPLQRVRFAADRFRSLLPLYAAYFSLLKADGGELVVSNSIAFSKAVRTPPSALHVCYVHAPMRYAWDLDRYLAGSSLSAPSRLAARAMRPFLQAWDRRTARGPDVIVANSREVAGRIRRLWRRRAEVINPPVDVAGIPLSATDDGYLLVVARLLAYRRVDLAVRACTEIGARLVVVGDGPERERLARIAGPSVEFLGAVSRERVIDLFARCHAYLLPGIEDFGMAPIEAMAAGKPVVAFAAGGALETVVDGVTGTFFERADPDALAMAIRRLETLPLDPARIRAHAEGFDASLFRERIRGLFRRLGVDPTLYSAD